MPSLRARLLGLAFRWFLRPRLNPQVAPEVQRRAVQNFSRLGRVPRKVSVSETSLGGRPALRMEPPNAASNRAILFFHGGGFCVGSPHGHRVLAAFLARASGCVVYSPQYRLAPEHPFPAALDDCYAALQALQEQFPASGLALAGDSAGACLSLSTCLRARENGTPLPVAQYLICPISDLTLSSESIKRHRSLEPLLTREWMDMCIEYYAAETPRDDPMMSPAFADLSGLPPMLIQAAGNDLLLDDARRLHAAARDAGVESKLDVFADLGHDFQAAADLVPEASRALTLGGAFIKVRQGA